MLIYRETDAHTETDRHHVTFKLFQIRILCRYAKNEPIYQAVWADNYDFDQVLISGCMVQVKEE